MVIFRRENYSSGKSINHIFLSFSSLSLTLPPRCLLKINKDTDLKSEVDRCLELPAAYNTVVRRAQLAQQIHELGKDELKNCDKLVHEQHLQHQGWMAVIANLEDITVAFQERCNEFDKVFKDHIERRTEYKDYLER
jgi:RB1-inducible coiled-coil protein 1